MGRGCCWIGIGWDGGTRVLRTWESLTLWTCGSGYWWIRVLVDRRLGYGSGAAAGPIAQLRGLRNRRRERHRGRSRVIPSRGFGHKMLWFRSRSHLTGHKMSGNYIRVVPPVSTLVTKIFEKPWSGPHRGDRGG